MAIEKVTLFEASNGSVVIKNQPISFDGKVFADGTVILREGLTKGQAEALAARLNGDLQESQQCEQTRRQQCFSVDVVYHFNFLHDVYDDDSANSYEAPVTVAGLRSDIRQYLKDNTLFEDYDGDVSDEKINVTVKKLYDKQIPNE